MQNTNKVKKWIDKTQENNLIQWKYNLIDLETWEIIVPKVKTSKYKLQLSNNKHFMKKWVDRKLNVLIKKELSLLEKELLFDMLDYIDENNIINLKLLANDYWYSASKISKAKSGLEEKLLIKKNNWILYLNPLVWIKAKEINQELLDLFKESFTKYWVEINY